MYVGVCGVCRGLWRSARICGGLWMYVGVCGVCRCMWGSLGSVGGLSRSVGGGSVGDFTEIRGS